MAYGMIISSLHSVEYIIHNYCHQAFSPYSGTLSLRVHYSRLHSTSFHSRPKGQPISPLLPIITVRLVSNTFRFYLIRTTHCGQGEKGGPKMERSCHSWPMQNTCTHVCWRQDWRFRKV